MGNVGARISLGAGLGSVSRYFGVWEWIIMTKILSLHTSFNLRTFNTKLLF